MASPSEVKRLAFPAKNKQRQAIRMDRFMSTDKYL